MTTDPPSTLHSARIWNLLEKYRGKLELGGVGSQRFSEIARSLQEQGEVLFVSDLLALQERLGEGDVTRNPAYFLELLVSSKQCSRVLNPSGNLGMIGALIAEGDSDVDVDIVSPFAESSEIFSALDMGNLSVHERPPGSAPIDLPGTYDAIVSSGPVGLGRQEFNYEGADEKITLRDEPSSLVIAEMEPRLGPDGFMAVVVSSRFVLDNGRHSVRANLGGLGLHLSALLALKPGAFIHASAIIYIAIVERKARKQLFVAEVPDDYDSMEEVVSRLWKRKQGRTAAHGRLVDPSEFHGLPALLARERYDKLGKELGTSAIVFSKAITGISAPKQSPKFELCQENECAVYLPEMAATKATVNPNGVPKSHIQLLVDPEVVSPDYLAGWLNTMIGQALRESAMTGATIPRIKRSILESRKLYLPPISDQRIALQALREVKRIRSEVSELESLLWYMPNEVAYVADLIGRVNREDLLSDWVETLPFPLASILRSYTSIDRDDKAKYERLLHFFEALAEYCAMIHMSAFKKNEARWQDQKNTLKRMFGEQGLSLKRSGFGLWRAIADFLASDLRKMIGKDDGRLEVLALYEVATGSPLGLLASKELSEILQRVNGFRNRWTGHGGAVTASEAKERYQQLSDELATLREFIGYRFKQHRLIEPQDCDVLEGPVFRCRIRSVMGSNPQLDHDEVDLAHPAIKGRLYLHEPGHDKALELVPFVQVTEAPQPASYFYNRTGSSGAHLVSYHFAETSEHFNESPRLTSFIDDFEAETSHLPEEAE